MGEELDRRETPQSHFTNMHPQTPSVRSKKWEIPSTRVPTTEERVDGQRVPANEKRDEKRSLLSPFPRTVWKGPEWGSDKFTEIGSGIEEEKAMPKSLFGDITDISEKRHGETDKSATTAIHGIFSGLEPSVSMHVP